MNIKIASAVIVITLIAAGGTVFYFSSPAQAPENSPATFGPTEPPPGSSFKGPTEPPQDQQTQNHSITVLTPNGGEILPAGQDFEVRWDYYIPATKKGVDCVEISLMRANANPAKELLWGYPEFVNYRGSVLAEKRSAKIEASGLPPDDDYQIKLSLGPCEKRADAVDQSDSSFIIGAPQDKITQVTYGCMDIKNTPCILPHIFKPPIVNIKLGDTILFKNRSGAQMWPASDPHPQHTKLSGFDARKSILSGGSYSYTFTEKGAWGYHNHLNPSATGTIIVE